MGSKKDDFLKIKRIYEERYSYLKIPENDFEMLNDFVRAIRKHDTRIDQGQRGKKGDLEILGEIQV